MALGAAEIGLRLAFPELGLLQQIRVGAEARDSRAYRLRPNARITFGGMRDRLERPVVWQVNAQGFRAEHPVPPRSARFRIATFGDSEAFGWGVPIESTFQRQMEKIDPRVEVFNLAVPGYNAENVADHLAEFIPVLKPDLVVYVFHKNDLDPALSRTPVLHRSYLWVLFRIATARVLIKKSDDYRRSPERLEFFAGQVERMIGVAWDADARLMIAFLHWRYRDALRATLGPAPDEEAPQVDEIDLEPIRDGYPEIDGHLTAIAHRAVAERICEAISGESAGSCMPPGDRP